MAPPMTSARVIHTKLPISGVAKVIAVATSMPTPAQMMPRLAVRGELMLFRPRMKRTAAAMYAIWIRSLRIVASLRLGGGRGALLLVAGALEHVQHALGHRVAADGVGGAEQYGEEADDALGSRVGRPERHHRAHDDDAVHEVGAAHQGRVQDDGHPGDDLVADEGGEDEDVDGGEAGDHDAPPSPVTASWGGTFSSGVPLASSSCVAWSGPGAGASGP